MARVQEDSHMPKPPAKAQAIANLLAAKIVEGEYAVASWLPSERELATEYAADRSTVRRALRLLADQGLVALQAGSGVQVRAAEPVRRDAADVTKQVGQWRGFAASAIESGHTPFTRTSVRETSAGSVVAKWLGVPTGTTILERARHQGIAGGPPIQISTTYVNWEFVEKLPVLRQVDTGSGGIYSRLDEVGHGIEVFEETVTCRMPRADEQGVLEIEATQPVLTLWRRAYDARHRIVEVTHRIVVGDRQDLVYRYGPGA
jgi:GntR family transcriptional regulator